MHRRFSLLPVAALLLSLLLSGCLTAGNSPSPIPALHTTASSAASTNATTAQPTTAETTTAAPETTASSSAPETAALPVGPVTSGTYLLYSVYADAVIGQGGTKTNDGGVQGSYLKLYSSSAQERICWTITRENGNACRLYADKMVNGSGQQSLGILDVYYSLSDTGRVADLWKLGTDRDQQWLVEQQADGTCFLRLHSNTALYLTCRPDQNEPLRLESALNDDRQRWILLPAQGGSGSAPVSDQNTLLYEALTDSWVPLLMGTRYDDFVDQYGLPQELEADLEDYQSFAFSDLDFYVNFDCNLRERTIDENGVGHARYLNDPQAIDALMSDEMRCIQIQYARLGDFSAITTGFLPDTRVTGTFIPNMEYFNTPGYQFALSGLSYILFTEADGKIGPNTLVVIEYAR